jgi:TRAP-type mannitol/chloroaromatic compound transport system substrate-binding protein
VFKWITQVSTSEGSTQFERAKKLFDKITTLTNGRVQFTVHGVNTIVPFAEQTQACQQGTLDCLSLTPHYDIGRDQALSLLGSYCFGFPTSEQYLDWYVIEDGVGMANQIYNQWNIHVVAQSGGNCGEIMGMTTKEYRTFHNMGGKIFRYSGLAGEVAQRAGLECVFIPTGEVFTALERGVIDVAELSGPEWNWNAGLHEIAPYALGPSWHQPSGTGLLGVNMDRWNELPEELKPAFEAACFWQYGKENAQTRWDDTVYLEKMLDYGVKFNRLPDRDLQILYNAWEEFADEMSAENANFKMIWESQRDWKAKTQKIYDYIWDITFTPIDKPLPKLITEKADWEDLSAYLPPYD